MTEHLIEANLHEFNTVTYVYSSFGCARYNLQIVLVVYDTFITFDIEMEYIWRSKFNLASYIFIVSRYIGILAAIVGILVSIGPVDGILDNNHTYHLPVLCNPNMGNVKSPLVYFIDPCTSYLGLYGSFYKGFTLGIVNTKQVTEAWSGIVVITSTLAKTFGLWRDSRKAGIRSPFTSLIIRDGAIYSLVTIFSSVVDMILDCKRGHKLNVLGIFGVTIASISVSRAILDLRSLPATSRASYDVANTIDNTVQVETLHFELSRTSILYRVPHSLPTRSMND
ncbi:hypothetical protein C8Q75DRAFT_735004 [Abortiporus biennis]|nr:hypothetical protein C8Q75DRAFT_735004 [Abortiporus biennis]